MLLYSCTTKFVLNAILNYYYSYTTIHILFTITSLYYITNIFAELLL